MGEPKVYVDVSFLVNFIMDFITLWATGKLIKIQISYRRLIIVAILGGIYGAAYLFSQLSFCYAIPIKLMFSCLLIGLAFKPHSLKAYGKILLYFYGINFLVAGATLALPYILNSNLQQIMFNYWWLTGGIICALLFGHYGEKYLSQKIIPAMMQYTVELYFGKAKCRGEAFLDTGNGLHDPLTHQPVVVAEYELIKDCVPNDCQVALEKYQDENDILQALSISSWANRLRIIPFSSIGKKNGIMIGFRCDQIVVDPNKINILYKNPIVGIHLDRLSSKDSYQVLIPSEILQNA